MTDSPRTRLVALLAVLLTPIWAWGQDEWEISFARYALGPLPPDFNTEWRTGGGTPGKWIVIEDPTARDGKAIAQTSSDRTDYRFPLAVYEALTAEDLDVSVRFKAVAGTIDQAG